MPDDVLLEEFQISLFVPADLGEPQVAVARQVLDRPAFRARLQRILCRLLDRHEPLRPLRVEVSR